MFNLLRYYMKDLFGVSKRWFPAITSLEKYHKHLMQLSRKSCTLLTVLTSRGRMNTIKKQRYQANNVAIITSLCCFLKSPYRWSRNKARKKTNTISRPSAAPLIVKYWPQPHHSHLGKQNCKTIWYLITLKSLEDIYTEELFNGHFKTLTNFSYFTWARFLLDKTKDFQQDALKSSEEIKISFQCCHFQQCIRTTLAHHLDIQ